MNGGNTFITVRGVILHNEKLLVVRHSPDSDFVALPGGHLECGEDVKECLSRELVEELGVVPEIGRLFYINTFIDTKREEKHYLEFFFEVKNGTDYLNIENCHCSHAHEIDEIIWTDPADDICILPKNFAKDFKMGKVVSDEVRYIKG